jgi:hypothetical protein
VALDLLLRDRRAQELGRLVSAEIGVERGDVFANSFEERDAGRVVVADVDDDRRPVTLEEPEGCLVFECGRVETAR